MESVSLISQGTNVRNGWSGAQDAPRLSIWIILPIPGGTALIVTHGFFASCYDASVLPRVIYAEAQ